VKIPVKTFPIKKRINTELFIDGEMGFYIQKRVAKRQENNTVGVKIGNTSFRLLSFCLLSFCLRHFFTIFLIL